MASRARLASAFVRTSWFPFRATPAAHQQPIRYQSRQFILEFKSSNRLFRRNYSKNPSTKSQLNPTPHLGSLEPQSFTARLKKLFREYGWTVLGVYGALTIADLPLCFLAVQYIGAERIAHVEHIVVGGAKDLIGRYFPNLFEKDAENEAEIEAAQAEQEAESGGPSERLCSMSIALLTELAQLSGRRLDWSCWCTSLSYSYGYLSQPL